MSSRTVASATKMMNTTDPQYVSCIKIDGVPILPPVISTSLRRELQQYKSQAVRIERRVSALRELKSRFQVDQDKITTTNGSTELHKQATQSLEHSLAFQQQDNAVPTQPSPAQSNISSKTPQMPSLSCSLHVSEYANNKFNVVDVDDLDRKRTVSSLSAETICIDLPSSFRQNTDDDVPKTPPKMIRRNSYTLDRPSPMFAKYIEENGLADVYASTPQVLLQSENCDDTLNDSTTIMTENDGCCDFDGCSELQNFSPDTADNSTHISHSVQIPPGGSRSGKKTTPSPNSPDVTEMSVSVLSEDCQQNGSMDDDEGEGGRTEQLMVGAEMREFVAKMPKPYAKQLLEVIAAQLHIPLSTSGTSNSPCQHRCDDSRCVTPVQQLQHINEKSILGSGATDKTVYYSVIDSGSEHSSPRGVTNSKHTRKVPRCNGTAEQRRQWAASVLGAATRGYLVRRLLRTERVKRLVATIHDSVLCAVQLHRDTVDEIKPADVELHRRLIQQVSAGCYEFHDIFFELSLVERMAIIGADRNRIRERLKRPPSVPVAGRSINSRMSSSFRSSTATPTTPTSSSNRRSLFGATIKT